MSTLAGDACDVMCRMVLKYSSNDACASRNMNGGACECWCACARPFHEKLIKFEYN